MKNVTARRGGFGPAGVALLAVVVMSACGGGGAAATHDLSGTLTVYRAKGQAGADMCTPAAPYDRIKAGASVLVQGEHDKIIGRAILGPGKPHTYGNATYAGYQTSYAGYCDFEFVVSDVPENVIYHVGRDEGYERRTLEELTADDWTVSLVYGSSDGSGTG